MMAVRLRTAEFFIPSKSVYIYIYIYCRYIDRIKKNLTKTTTYLKPQQNLKTRNILFT